MFNTKKDKRDWFEIAALLRQMSDEDPEKFLNTAHTLGIHRRKAYYLVDLDRSLEAFEIPRARKLRIGWTKLQVIGPNLTQKNREVLLAQAEAHPVHELRDIVQGTWPGATKHCVLLYLADEEYGIFAQVLKAHGAKRVGRGIRGKEAALIAALKTVMPDPE